MFEGKVEKICAYCEKGQDFSSEHDLCRKYGPVPPEHTCPHFKYDPLRRTPPRPAPALPPHNPEDFKL